MKIITKTLACTLACLFLTISTYAAQIAIVESQSVHPLHSMDDNWLAVAESLGHDAIIVDQSFLNDFSNFANYDVIMTTSGLIDIPDNSKSNLLQFVQNGGEVYLQSEYLMDLPGNVTFKFITESLGNEFNWEGETTGNLTPMEITGSLALTIPDGTTMDYYWYGTYGSGDANFEPFLTHDNKSWGFLYCPPSINAGRVVTTTDQDWVRISAKNTLMESILNYLTEDYDYDALPTVSIDPTSNPCDNTYTFTATIDNDLPGTMLQWTVNGQIIADESEVTYSSSDLLDGDVVECRITFSDACANYAHVSNPVLIAPIFPASTLGITISTDNTEFCQGQTVTFTSNTTDAPSLTSATYQWFVNNQMISGATSATFTTSDLNDEDSVTCEFTYSDPCTSNEQILSNLILVTVTEALDPEVTITADLTNICAGEMVNFTAVATESGVNPIYQWQIDGVNVGTNSATFFTTDLTNTQNVNCFITSQELCSTTSEAYSNTIAISVNEAIIPTIQVVASSNATTVCPGQSVTFIASGDNHGSNPVYNWTVNGETVDLNSAQLTIGNMNSTQAVSCELTTDEVCVAANAVTSEVITVNVADILIDVLELANENCGKADGFIEVAATGGQAPYTYAWSSGNTEAFITDATAGNYELLVTDFNGCSATTILEMGSTEGPEIADIEISNADCDGDNSHVRIVFNDSENIVSIDWKNAAGEIVFSGADARDLLPGTYEIDVTNEWGCMTSESVTIEQFTAVSLTVEDLIRMDLGTSVQLQTFVNIDEVTYEWYPAEGLSCTDCPNPVANPVSTTQYTVVVTNAAGCSVNNDIIVHVIPKDDLFIPNAFSPNGDGINDFFTVYGGSNVEKVKTLRVFDRWGAEVYGNQDFSVNMDDEGWNGTFKGKAMDMGVYIYYVEVEYIDGSTKIKKGDLSITK